MEIFDGSQKKIGEGAQATVFLYNCVGDIGSHIEHTVSYITSLRLKRVAAVLDNFGQPLDMNANILVEFDNGAHGVFSSSQVCVGHMNGFVVRIFGTEGAIGSSRGAFRGVCQYL